MKPPVLPLALWACLMAVESAADDAVVFGAVYTGEINANVSGGLRTGSRYLDNLDLTLDLDVERAFGAGSGRVFLYGLYNNGTTFAAPLAGDLQVTSNIDAPEAVRLFEAWYELEADRWSVRAGLYDLNSEFDAHTTGSLFLNSSHGIGAEFAQAGRNGPSIFPVSSMALRGEWRGERLTVRAAVLDGVPGDPADSSSNEVAFDDGDGVLQVLEADIGIGRDGRAWAGRWRYTGSFARPFDTGRSGNNAGWYAGIEHGFAVGKRQAALFLRFGEANETLNPLADYAGAGIVVEGVFAARPDDRFGLAVASAGAGDGYRRRLAAPASRETTWEMSYRVVLNEHVALQPDIQYVVNPGARQDIDNTLVLALRAVFSY